MQLKKGDTIYMFTDSFANRFRGPLVKKIKFAKLKELLLKIRAENMKSQKHILKEEFHKWKGNLEQVDDVLIVGIRM